MSAFHCSCGFAADDPAELGDHFREVFTPPDDMGTDGRIHDEADGKWLSSAGIPPQAAFTCLCGFAASRAAELDDHFLIVFTPPGSTGTDGSRHVPVDTATPVRWRIT